LLKTTRTLEILDPLPIQLNPAEISKQLRMSHTGQKERIQKFVAKYQNIIDAKAVYKVSYVDDRRERAVRIDGVTFSSGILRKNLDQVQRVFPFIVTIGEGLQEKVDQSENLMDKYVLDVIGNIALGEARRSLKERLKKRYALKGLSFMSPGSLADWPIEEQVPLFSLFEDQGGLPISVRLNPSLMMIPVKSISGIYFPTEIPFYSCQLCPRDRCPGRKAAYDRQIARAYMED
jgi:hypothetical protein